MLVAVTVQKDMILLTTVSVVNMKCLNVLADVGNLTHVKTTFF